LPQTSGSAFNVFQLSLWILILFTSVLLVAVAIGVTFVENANVFSVYYKKTPLYKYGWCMIRYILCHPDDGALSRQLSSHILVVLIGFWTTWINNLYQAYLLTNLLQPGSTRVFNNDEEFIDLGIVFIVLFCVMYLQFANER
jgi:hypothetical protein